MIITQLGGFQWRDAKSWTEPQKREKPGRRVRQKGQAWSPTTEIVPEVCLLSHWGPFLFICTRTGMIAQSYCVLEIDSRWLPSGKSSSAQKSVVVEFDPAAAAAGRRLSGAKVRFQRCDLDSGLVLHSLIQVAQVTKENQFLLSTCPVHEQDLGKWF